MTRHAMALTPKQRMIGLCAAVGIGVMPIFAFMVLAFHVGSGQSGQPSDVRTAIRCTLEWGRLSPFPASAEQITITTEGSMFTRAFRASFTAPAPDIERWLQDSPGTRAAISTSPSPGVRHFEIAPGGGAQHGEVNVDDALHSVSIYVFWS
jgi:hypothetical protein